MAELGDKSSSEYGEGHSSAETLKESIPPKDASTTDDDDEELKRLGSEYKRDPVSRELIYVDPVSKSEYVLSEDKTQWVPKETKQDYEFDGSTYLHTDEKGIKHRWDLEKQVWTKTEGEKVGEKDEEEEEEESEEDDETTDEQRKQRQYRKRKAQPGWGSGGEYLKDPDTGVQLYRCWFFPHTFFSSVSPVSHDPPMRSA